MVLIDANVFMYAAGTTHPNKAPSTAFLDKAARGEIDAAVDAEVLQEILHRYRAIDRWLQGRQVYDSTRRIIPTVISITERITDSARYLMDVHENLGARDALHVAVYNSEAAESWCSFDRDFDAVPGLVRKEPGSYLSS